MTLAKKILTASCMLMILATFGLMKLTKNVAPSTIKDSINQQLSASFTQQSRIAGDISWHLFPRPGIKTTKIYIDIIADKTNYSVSIDNLFLNLQITALLRGQLVFNELRLDGMKINIRPDALRDASPNPIPVVVTSASRKNYPNKVSAQFALHDVLLTHGQITIDQPSNKLILSNVQIGAKQLNLKNGSFSLQLRATLAASIATNKIKASLKYNGQVDVNPSTFSQPLAAFNNLSMDGQLTASNLRFNQLKIEKINTNLKKKQDEILFNPFNISLYSGESIGDLSYQFSSKKLTINQTATKLNANRLFNDLFSQQIVIGALDFSVHASTKLANNSFEDNLRGNGNLTLKNGTLYYIDLNKFTDEAINKLHSLISQETINEKTAIKHPLLNPMATKSGHTNFQLLSIRYSLLDGKLISDRLLLQTDTLQLKGNGRVNLIDASQDFNLSAKLTHPDPDITLLQQRLGGSFPLRICGTITKPQILPNMQELGQVISNYLLKSTLEKPVTQIKKSLKYLLTTTENLLQ